ncbi:hypothetical protein HNQ88_001022 [Aureibacter tunicatorum]|uniref:Uncharacterized protein n=1 Tax=Aureibacter tunicatorum TaxID=866807 RepID=A0AAE4BQX2_9BACT|nr:hypothetical protein [Aureibacter tunicatorum]BDD03079.1 hypothetical protein AUTU_05620 [Aureibacter tunicatorum]
MHKLYYSYQSGPCEEDRAIYFRHKKRVNLLDYP